MALKIIRNDITCVAADAVVNTANPEPCIGAGTDAAIHAAAGPELLEARRAIGHIDPGSAAATPAFGLPARYVLHTVSQIWTGGGNGETAALRQAYDAALSLAVELGCRSVAFPLMAAGSYGFPHDVALSVAVQAITDFLMEHEITVWLVLYDGKAFGLASSLFDDLKSYIDDRYVSAAAQRQKSLFGNSLRRAESKRLPPVGSGAVPGHVAADFCASAPMASDLSDILDRSGPTFSQHLLDLLRERSGKDSAVYKRAEISKQLFSRILSTPDYRPTKTTAIQLAIGLQLDLAQTQKLLETAGYTLTRSSKTDLVVQYYIERKVYNVTFINEALSDCGLPLLSTGLKQ